MSYLNAGLYHSLQGKIKMKNQCLTFSMDAVRGADLTQRDKAIANVDWPVLTKICCFRTSYSFHWRLFLEAQLTMSHDGMMTLSNGNIFRVNGPSRGEFTGQQWIPLTKASDAELWCFLWSAPHQTVEKKSRRRWFDTPLRLLWCYCNRFRWWVHV